MSHGQSTHTPASPLVVQLGFAGSRFLFDRAAHPDLDEARFHKEVEDHLDAVLEKLPETLGLSPRHFLCGISQVAIGADTLFTLACARRRIAQRIFLPEHRDAYLAAQSAAGTRDFSDAQATTARELLASTHIIEDRVVSDSTEREQRFEDVNLEIVRISDVLIALHRENADGKPGGTLNLLDRARAWKKPVLEITVSVRDGHAHFRDEWHPVHPHTVAARKIPFSPPGVPKVIADFHHEGESGCAEQLKSHAAEKARRHQRFFIYAALIIIGTHVAATILAASGLAFEEPGPRPHAIILCIELSLLSAGLFTHWLLHRTGAVERWATARLVSEITRSFLALRGVRGYLRHLFILPLPAALRPLLRTLNTFHLKDTRHLARDGWRERRDAYVHTRLEDHEHGQLRYFREKRDNARRWLRISRAVFYTGSTLTLLCTLVKLLHCFGVHTAELLHIEEQAFSHWLGFLAVVLPVIAVAALSLAASFDLEAREHTYSDMLDALHAQCGHLHAAASEGEFHALALQTETLLLGENANWYSRRVSFSVN